MSRYDSQAVVVDDATRKGARRQHETHRCDCGHYASIHIGPPAPLPHGHWCGSCVPLEHMPEGRSAPRLTRDEARRRLQLGPPWAKRRADKKRPIVELQGGQAKCNAAIKKTCEAFMETDEWKAAVRKWETGQQRKP